MTTDIDPALFCTKKSHRRRRGELVLAPRSGRSGRVLTEGFDVHGEHVGWVGVPGQGVTWTTLCHLVDGDQGRYDDQVAHAKPGRSSVGSGVEIVYTPPAVG